LSRAAGLIVNLRLFLTLNLNNAVFIFVGLCFSCQKWLLIVWKLLMRYIARKISLGPSLLKVDHYWLSGLEFIVIRVISFISRNGSSYSLIPISCLWTEAVEIFRLLVISSTNSSLLPHKWSIRIFIQNFLNDTNLVILKHTQIKKN